MLTMETMDDTGREDSYSAPKVTPGEHYQFVLVLVKDSALAATCAAEVIWHNTKIHEASCTTHANILWSNNNAAKFRKIKNMKAISRDIQYRYKVIGHINPIPESKLLMRLKWEKVLKEKDVTAAWFASSENAILTRVHNCQEHLCLLSGGVLCDNNAIEAGNHADKMALDFKRNTLLDH